MDESSSTQNRRSRRSNVLLAASIESGGKQIAVKLRNLSSEGALVEGAGLPLEGAPVVFRRNELEVGSRVAWVHGKHAGIAFGNPLKAEEVLRNIPKPRARFMPDFRRPGLASKELSDGERLMIEQWVQSSPLGSLGD